MVVTHAKTQLAVHEAIHACNLDASTHVLLMDSSLFLHKVASSLTKTPAMHVDPDANAFLLVTSGSSGPPKLVTVSLVTKYITVCIKANQMSDLI